MGGVILFTRGGGGVGGYGLAAVWVHRVCSAIGLRALQRGQPVGGP